MFFSQRKRVYLRTVYWKVLWGDQKLFFYGILNPHLNWHILTFIWISICSLQMFMCSRTSMNVSLAKRICLTWSTPWSWSSTKSFCAVMTRGWGSMLVTMSLGSEVLSISTIRAGRWNSGRRRWKQYAKLMPDFISKVKWERVSNLNSSEMTSVY